MGRFMADTHARGGEALPVHPPDPVNPAGHGGGESGHSGVAGLHSGTSAAQAMEAPVVALFNQQRAAHGLKPFTVDARLRQAAQAHSIDMLQHGYFAHDDARGTWDARIRRYVTRSEVGEILSFGSGEYATPAGMVQSWMQSTEHRTIILTPELCRVGFGVATGTYKGEAAVSMATADFSTAA
jgi:uncharacterized protein YkwD